MTEIELAKTFIAQFKEEDSSASFFEEVQSANGSTDLVMIKNDLTIGVEFKTSFSTKVIEQAYRNQNCYDFSVVAIPEGKRGVSSFNVTICKKFGIGVYSYEPWLRTPWIKRAEPNQNYNVRYRPKLHDFYADNTAGAQSGAVTPWKKMILEIAEALKEFPLGAHHSVLYGLISTKQYDATSFNQNLSSRCNQGVITEFEYLGRGIYKLREL